MSNAIDLVFDPQEESPGGYHQTHHQTAPGAWDHLNQAQNEPDNLRPKALHNALQVPPTEAMSVFQRSPNRHTIRALPIAGTLLDTQGPSELVENQKGRAYLIVQCPSTNTKGIFISEEKDSLDSNPPVGWHLAPNDPPLTIHTEDTLWYKADVGAASTDTVQLCVAWSRGDPI